MLYFRTTKVFWRYLGQRLSTTHSAGTIEPITVESLLLIANTQHNDPMTLELNERISSHAASMVASFDRAAPSSRSTTSLLRLFLDTRDSTQRFATKKGDLATAMMCKANARNLDELKARHGSVIETITEIFAKKTSGNRNSLTKEEEEEIAVVYEKSISLSMLIQHAAELTHLKHPHREGVVRLQEPLHGLLQHAATLVTALAGHNYSELCPSIEIAPEASSVYLTCLPQVIEFALVEALKNAVYATMERHSGGSGSGSGSGSSSGSGSRGVPPPVTVDVMEDDSSVTINIVDSGSGIPSTSSIKKAYNFAGAASTAAMVDMQTSYQPVSSPLRGFHVGVFLAAKFLETTSSGSYHLKSDGQNKGTIASIILRKVQE